MTTWQDKVKKTTPYVPGEQRKVPGLIKLNTNENPYPPAPEVEDILKKFSHGDLSRYPEPNVSVLKEALADYHGIDPGRVFVGVGSDDVLAMAFMTFFNSDLPILFADITYSFYDVWADFFGISYKRLPLREDFTIDVSDYSIPNGGIVIANPNAPTGLALDMADIERLLEDNRESIVIVDEAYVDFHGESAEVLLDKFDNLLVTRTFSKSRALAGNRIGYALGSAEAIGYLWASRNSFNSYTISNLSMDIAVASVRDDKYFRECVDAIIDTREKFKKSLKALGFSFPDSRANFLFAKHESLSAEEIYKYLYHRNILVRHFKQPGIDNYLRITIGTPEDMDKLLLALSEYVKEAAL